MKKTFTLLSIMALCVLSMSAQQYTENLGRGAVVMGAGRAGCYLTWRSLATDDPNMTFDIYRNGTRVASMAADAPTCYTDNGGKISNNYVIKAMVNGEVVEEFEPMSWNATQKIELVKPADGTTPGGETYSYSPNDCSVGDVDGDGEYEIVLKWDPSNAKDNSQGGYTGNVYLDCYKLNGEHLWCIDLGPNIRAGAHYTQFLVYDFDGDGHAEVICKTGPGSVDGTGRYVNEAATDDVIKGASNTKDWRTSDGRVDGGQEWLTAFNGLTGQAIHTIYYNPNRNTTVGGDSSGSFNWDDRSGRNDKGNYGNRGERYLATVAHLDGQDAPASAVMTRGYYTYAFLWAVDFDGAQLRHRWLHSSKTRTSYTVTDRDGNVQQYNAPAPTRGSGSRTAYGNGNHNMSLGDVDGDGKDEIIWGACCIDDDGTLRYATGFGHGDAMHVGRMIPDRPGLQVYTVHEESPYGWDLHDAGTGEILFNATADGDTGRGIAADIDGKSDGWEMWCSASSKPRSVITGKQVLNVTPSVNFRVYWNGDLYDDLLDGNKITTYSDGSMSTLATLSGSSCNGTKSTPCLSADILGDWREEVILRDNDSKHLIISSTTIATEYRVPCLMQDHTYRMAITWQNGAYNQPPHLGYNLPKYVAEKQSGISDIITDCNGQAAVYSATTGVLMGRGELDQILRSLQRGVYVVVGADGNASKIAK